MIRKSILSIFGGVIFAAILSFAVPAKAACYGMCADRIGDYWSAGCHIEMHCVADAAGDLDCIYRAWCWYTHAPMPVDPNVAD